MSNWKRTADQFDLDTETTVNTTATIYLPTSTDQITEGGKPLTKVVVLKFVRQESDRAGLSVESGKYRFSSKLNP